MPVGCLSPKDTHVLNFCGLRSLTFTACNICWLTTSLGSSFPILFNRVLEPHAIVSPQRPLGWNLVCGALNFVYHFRHRNSVFLCTFNFEIILDLQKSCRDSTKIFNISFTQFVPLLIYYRTVIHYEN